jgi:hypothetical protein
MPVAAGGNCAALAAAPNKANAAQEKNFPMRTVYGVNKTTKLQVLDEF